jgi:hypothetical protein
VPGDGGTIADELHLANWTFATLMAGTKVARPGCLSGTNAEHANAREDTQRSLSDDTEGCLLRREGDPARIA